MKSELSFRERDARVIQLHEQLVEIEQRLIPTGLHVFGRASELKEKTDLLRMVASFDRPEHDAQALPSLVAEGLGLDPHDPVVHELSTSETRELIDGSIDQFPGLACRKLVNNRIMGVESESFCYQTGQRLSIVLGPIKRCDHSQ